MRSAYTLIGVGVAAVFAMFYFLLGLLGGLGDITAHWQAYCEAPVSGAKFIRQPACFWSDIGFVVVGLVALLYADITGSGNRKRLFGANPLAIGFGIIVVWMGPGSMLEHGTLNNTWGWFDATSIHWFGLLTSGLVILGWAAPAETARRGYPIFYAIVGLCAVAVGAISIMFGEWRMYWTIILLVLTLVLLVIDFVVWVTGNHRFQAPASFWNAGSLWIFLGLVSFGVAMLLWAGGQEGEFLCPAGQENEHVLQAHAGFHLLAALAILFIWLYFVRRERDA